MYPRTKYVARENKPKKFNQNKLDNPFLIGIVEFDLKLVLIAIYQNICTAIFMKNNCFLKNAYFGSALLPTL